MTHDIIPDLISTLPPTPAGWFDYGYAVLCNGELALLRTDCDIHTALACWREEAVKSSSPGQRPDLAEARLRLSTFDGMNESTAIEVPAGRWPKVDRMPDGRWLVVSDPPEQLDDKNARLYAVDGRPAGAFAIGYCISHVQCAVDGTVWAGYIDQGVLVGEPAISSAGVARFEADGQIIWRFNEIGRGLFVFDCYAMALEGETLWTCFYTDFPIVRIEHGVVTHWRNRISGADALAIDGDHVLLAGGYKEESSRLVLLHLADGEARLKGQWRFTPPALNQARLVQGRGGTLHVVGSGVWRRIAVATLRARRSDDGYRPDEPA